VTASAGDVVLYSVAGGIAMDAGTSVTASAAVVLNAAGSLAVGQISAINVVLRSSSGAIVDVNGDDAVNVSAGTVSLYGYGAPVGTGNPIEVQAPAIYLAARTGVELQDTGPDGRTHFYVLDGATMYEQAVGIGNAVRTTVDPTPAATFPAAAAMASDLFAPAAFAPSIREPGSSDVARYLAGLDAAAVTSAMPHMSAAPAMQADAGLTLAFDFWLEDLVV
jgi:hypothetical protein